MNAKEEALEKRFTDAFARGFADGLKKAKASDLKHSWPQPQDIGCKGNAFLGISKVCYIMLQDISF